MFERSTRINNRHEVDLTTNRLHPRWSPKIEGHELQWGKIFLGFIIKGATGLASENAIFTFTVQIFLRNHQTIHQITVRHILNCQWAAMSQASVPLFE